MKYMAMDVLTNTSVNNEYALNYLANFRSKTTLLASIRQLLFHKSNFGFMPFSCSEELYDKKTLKIIIELAKAIDKNSSSEIKFIKLKYGKTRNFADAKHFLDKQCKKVWDVFDSSYKEEALPHEAMKTLGISNKPSLEFLLQDSIKYFAKGETDVIPKIIEKILANEHLQYTMEDIGFYLKQELKRQNTELNLVTTLYLAKKMDFDTSKLLDFGICKNSLSKLFKAFSFKNKLKYLVRNYL